MSQFEICIMIDLEQIPLNQQRNLDRVVKILEDQFGLKRTEYDVDTVNEPNFGFRLRMNDNHEHYHIFIVEGMNIRLEYQPNPTTSIPVKLVVQNMNGTDPIRGFTKELGKWVEILNEKKRLKESLNHVRIKKEYIPAVPPTDIRLPDDWVDPGFEAPEWLKKKEVKERENQSHQINQPKKDSKQKRITDTWWFPFVVTIVGGLIVALLVYLLGLR